MSQAQAEAFVDCMNQRQTAVQLGPHVPVPLPYVQSIAANVLYNNPTPFNSQSTRIVMLVGSDHKKFWEAIANNNMYTEEREAIEQNLQDAAGTFVFFEDGETVEGLQKQLPSYADAFPTFAEHSSAMTISCIWDALSLVGVGACVHHYSPDVAAKAANVPHTWRCTGQLVFGSTVKPALRASHSTNDSHRFKVAKGDL